MTVIGTASLEKERDAYQRQRVRQLAYAEKRRVAVRGGQTRHRRATRSPTPNTRNC